ncbi:hypothetical protein CAEBREN_18780 [Caenorhabditis brenneri]|uniref:F-box domain-containing protein n=1 Tax=Caenorhabditis brenneri TaxID=135651 RepID=G0N3I5_CAEBE|nr:hypothetical protein CAEBREN_18780 [Caenorhabditis brenneri]
MDAVEFWFPLLNLPEKAWKYVLQYLDTVDQLSLSLCCEELKTIINAHHPKACVTCVYIKNSVGFEIMFPGVPNITITFFDQEMPLDTDPQLPIPEIVKVKQSKYIEDDVLTQWNNSQSFQYWIDHFKEVFDCSEISLSFELEEELNPIFYNSLEKLTIGDIELNTLTSEDLVTKFVSRTEKLFINGKHPFKKENFQKICIQNFEKLHLLNHEISMDTVLLINASTMAITTKFREKELNMYLKLWKNGANPRMRCLRMSIERKLNHNLVLKGIKFEEAPHEKKMQFKLYRDQFRRNNINPEDLTNFGGFIIKRNGDPATILIVTTTISTCFQMLVHS